MSDFLIASQILVFLHISAGELAGASLLWSLKELVYFRQDRIKWLKISLWIAFVGVMLAWIFGGGYYLSLYPLVKPIIKEGPEAWAHLIFTETKEHIFFFLPILTFLLASFASKKSTMLLENNALKKNFTILTALTALLIFSMAFMGYMITWGARTALWIKAGF